MHALPPPLQAQAHLMNALAIQFVESFPVPSAPPPPPFPHPPPPPPPPSSPNPLPPPRPDNGNGRALIIARHLLQATLPSFDLTDPTLILAILSAAQQSYGPSSSTEKSLDPSFNTPFTLSPAQAEAIIAAAVNLQSVLTSLNTSLAIAQAAHVGSTALTLAITRLADGSISLSEFSAGTTLTYVAAAVQNTFLPGRISPSACGSYQMPVFTLPASCTSPSPFACEVAPYESCQDPINVISNSSLLAVAGGFPWDLLGAGIDGEGRVLIYQEPIDLPAGYWAVQVRRG